MVVFYLQIELKSLKYKIKTSFKKIFTFRQVIIRLDRPSITYNVTLVKSI